MKRITIVGAGAVGCSVALHAARTGHDVVVLEKEQVHGLHQSGRNSGVIHAGYNLRPGSEKARYCIEGNHRMHAFCAEHAVPVRRGGILVVARNEAERRTLDELETRGKANDVPIERVDGDGIRRLEPHAAGIDGIHASTGSSVDAKAYVDALRQQAEKEGARFLVRHRVRSWKELDDSVEIQAGPGILHADVMVNAAGLHADRVARSLAKDLRAIPFRGYYVKLRPGLDLVRSHLYSAPRLDFPFLGVHLSHRTDGEVFVGPGAMPALGREAYRLWQLNPRDAWDLATWPGTWRLSKDARVRRLVRGELSRSLWRKAIWKEAHRLVPSLRERDLVGGVPAGNRAQLLDRSGNLVDDVVVRSTARTIHVLNAVSPGLTSSLPFGEALAQQAAGLL